MGCLGRRRLEVQRAGYVQPRIGYDDLENFAVVANVDYELVNNFHIIPEITYEDNSDDVEDILGLEEPDEWGGFLRLQANFGG